jgi:transcription antitermination protein NusB
MGNRRRSRELAMQALFYMDLRNNASEERLNLFCESCQPSKKARPFFLKLVNGVKSSRDNIDTIVERFSSNWKINRMSGVDRNIIRIAIYEMMCCDDIPPRVSINEAIDIGKKYGTEESGAFINGILDSIHLEIQSEHLELLPDAPHTDPDDSGLSEPSLPGVLPDIETRTTSRVKVKENVVRRRNLKPSPSSDGG